MLGYAFVGTNDLDRALAFYDGLAASVGAKRKFPVPGDRGWFYGGDEGALLAVAAPYDGGAASAGNGTMIALSCRDRAQVDEAYRGALAAGAPSEGEPGERVEGFYGAYVRDPDGNKICLFKMG